MATSKEVLKYIGELGISKVQLRPEDRSVTGASAGARGAWYSDEKDFEIQSMQQLRSLCCPPLPLSPKIQIHPRGGRRVNSY